MDRNNLSSYPDFNKRFEVRTNTSDFWLGAVIGQEVKPISFYSRKMTVPQKGKRYDKSNC